MIHAQEASSSKKQLLGWSRRLGDAGLGVAVTAVVIMMVVPLTPMLIDLLIGINIGFSALILCLSLFMSRPLAFTAFPTLLLAATLYRLALNVSSTRLILLKADAGQIIRAFGGYIVGGDILVGAVIFGILAMVLFLVITKGAERVAEVAARFSLDSLPGMQLAVDSDLRAGAVSPAEASRRRAALDETSRYFGALDGAMKFIRGDAIASLVIVLINIVGGIAVGMMRRGMSIGEAIDTYGRLTVGDGLVSMIPALLVSTAAGFLVTRVVRTDKGLHLGKEINRQLRAEPRAMAATGVLMLLLALVPGLPMWPFILLASVFGAVAVYQLKAERIRGMSPLDESSKEPPSVESAAVVLAVAPDLYRKTAQTGAHRRFWRDIALRLDNLLSEKLGFIDMRVLVIPSDEAPRGGMLLHLKKAVRIRISPKAEALTPRGIETAVSKTLLRNAACLVGMDETQRLLDAISHTRPAAIRETVPRQITLPALTALLGRLLEDGIPLTVLPEILELVARAPSTLSPADLLERVREGLAPLITGQVMGDAFEVRAFVLSRDIESVLEGSLTISAGETRPAMPPQDLMLIVDAVKNTVSTQPAVLIVPAHLRAPMARLLSEEIKNLRVLKSTELSPDASIRIEGTVGI
jgi:type III secretory pathway component EscV